MPSESWTRASGQFRSHGKEAQAVHWQRHQVSRLVYPWGARPICRKLSAPHFWPLAVTDLGEFLGPHAWHLQVCVSSVPEPPPAVSPAVLPGGMPRRSHTAGPSPLPRITQQSLAISLTWQSSQFFSARAASLCIPTASLAELPDRRARRPACPCWIAHRDWVGTRLPRLPPGAEPHVPPPWCFAQLIRNSDLETRKCSNPALWPKLLHP